MKPKQTLVWCVALVLVSVHAFGAEADPKKVETILERHVTAIGGKAAIEKVKTRVWKGKLEIPGMGANDWELVAKAPNKQLSETEMAGVGKITEGFDGTIAWSRTGTTIREKSGTELAKVKRDTEFHRELRLQALYPDLAYKGTEQVDGEDVEVLESKPGPDSLERFSFSKKSGLLVRQESQFATEGGQARLDVRLKDYQPTEGIQSPRKLGFSMAMGDQAFGFELQVVEVKYNVEIPDARFAKPTQ